MRFRATSFVLCSMLALMLSQVVAQESQPSEYAIKSAFLLNFLKFVEWPETALPEKTSPMVIGLYEGASNIQKDLQRVVQNHKIEEHLVVVQNVNDATGAARCHLLFFDAAHEKNAAELLKQLKGKSVLTVGEADGFIAAGGIINFVRVGTKIRFQIQKDTASIAGLQISAKLLSLAQPLDAK